MPLKGGLHRRRTAAGAACADDMLVCVWRYTLRDLLPTDDAEAWALALAAEGWRLWPKGTGVLITIDGREMRRYSLRRWAGDGTPPEPVEGQ